MFSNLFSNKNMFSYDWGGVTVDGFNKEKNEALLVYNFDISTTEKINHCLVFMTGRSIWLARQLPQNTIQKIVLDLRGQPITFIERARKMKQDFLKQLGSLKMKNTVIVEILI